MGSLPRESDHITQATMNSFVCISAILAVAAAAPQFPGTYNGDASLAKILQEQRFNVGNDQFGHAAHQEDGTILRLESTAGNTRIGQYQYIGDDGKTYTVKYEAGVNGFRILDGSHIPSGGQTAANADPEEEYDYAYYDEAIPDSPFVNPYDKSHQHPDLLAGNLAGHLAGLYREPASTTPKPSLLINAGIPTPSPKRIFPPGSLNFDRFAQGFKFDFKSQK